MLVSARSQTDHSLASPEHSIASKSNKSLEREQTRERRKFHSDLATNSRLAADVSTASSEPAQMQAIMDHQEISAAIRTTRLQVTSKADKGVRKQMVPRGAMRLAILLLSLASCNLLAKVQCDHGQESATGKLSSSETIEHAFSHTSKLSQARVTFDLHHSLVGEQRAREICYALTLACQL